MSKLKNSQSPCIICHRVSSGLYQSYKKKALEVVKRFFPLFESYVDDNDNHVVGSLGVTGGEILPCSDCLRIVQSFCEWHEQLKSIEKMLDEKVEKLQSLMLTAWRTPSIQKAFRDSAKQTYRGMTDKDVDTILDHKETLIQKCDRKLKRADPRETGRKIISVTVHKVFTSNASPGNPKVPGPATHPNSGVTSTSNSLGQRKRKRGQLNSIDEKEITSPVASEQDSEDPTQLGNDESSFDSTIVKEEFDTDQSDSSESDTGQPLPDPRELPESTDVEQAGKDDRDESDMEMSTSKVNASSPSSPAPKSSHQNDNLEMKGVKPSELRKFECKKCGKHFTRNDGLLNHMKVVHLKLREHFCGLCGKDFGLLVNLQVHMKTIHSNSREHVCEQCGKGYPTARSLRRHVTSTHSEVGEFPCDLCGKMYRTSFSLQCHRREKHKDIIKKIMTGTSGSGT